MIATADVIMWPSGLNIDKVTFLSALDSFERKSVDNDKLTQSIMPVFSIDCGENSRYKYLYPNIRQQILSLRMYKMQEKCTK